MRMGVQSIPVAERPRERLYQGGAAQLSLQELIAVVIGSGTRSASALVVALRVLERFDGIGELGRAEVDDLRGIPGIGTACASRLVAAFELGRRGVLNAPRDRCSLRSPQDVAGYFTESMAHLDREHFRAALLNTKNRLIRSVTVSIGSLNASIVHPREVLKPAIAASAASIILVHNHPTGDPTPSREDIEFTRRFARCGELMGIELLDHVIIGSGRYESLKEGGYF